MSKVIAAWEQLLRDALATDYDAQQEALFKIALVLQRHNPNSQPESDMQEAHLSRELLRLTLNEQRLDDALTYLATLVRNQPKASASILFAMSNAPGERLAMPLFALLKSIGSKWGTETAYQALLALEGVIRTAPHTAKQAATTHNIQPLLDEWAEHSDDLLADKADLMFVRLNQLLEVE